MSFLHAARAYELLCDPARVTRELAFLAPWCAGRAVLDLACGLGDHLAALLTAGAIPGGAGVDLSATMLERARRRHPDSRLAFTPGDLSQVDPGDVTRVMCLGNAVNCLPDTASARAAIARLTAALPADGRLLVQVTNPQRSGAEYGCVVRRAPDAIVVKTVVHSGDRSLLTVALHLREGATWTSAADHQVLLRLSADDLLAAAHAGGAREAVLLGGLDGSEFTPASSADVVLGVLR